MSRTIVGIDVSCKTVDVAVIDDGKPAVSLGKFTNDSSGFEQLKQVLERQVFGTTLHVVMEPTGGYEQPLAHFAIEQGWQVSLPNPRHVREWGQSQGRRTKTDRQDALLLARYGAANQLWLWQPLPQPVAELDALLARRSDLEGMLQQELNRRHAVQSQDALTGPVAASLEQSIAWLQAAIAGIEQAIASHLDHHPDLKDEVRHLQKVPGIGKRNVLPILVLLHRWATYTSYQGTARGITAFVGLDPLFHDSGDSIHLPPRISRQGDSSIRSLLYISALGGTRGNNALRNFYQHLVAAGKPKKLALVAAARKILIWAWAVFRSHTDFVPAQAGFVVPALC